MNLNLSIDISLITILVIFCMLKLHLCSVIVQESDFEHEPDGSNSNINKSATRIIYENDFNSDPDKYLYIDELNYTKTHINDSKIPAAVVQVVPVVEERLDNIDERGKYFEGDIRFPEHVDAASGGSGLIDTRMRWPDRRVIYQFSPLWGSDEKMVVLSAMEEISQKTNCIEFVRRTTVAQTDYVYIVHNEDGCWSYIGRIGGMQKLNLGSGCVTKGIAVHELMHAVGFEHEQSRSDRDDYIKVAWENVEDSALSNFEKYPTTKVNPYGVDYDFYSIMHYSAYAFSGNRKPTLVPKKKSIDLKFLGQRKEMTNGDVRKIQNMYGCSQ